MEEKVVKPIVAAEQAPQPQNTVVVEAKSEPTSPSAPTGDTETAGDDKITFPEGHYLTSPLFYEVANYFGINQEEYAGAKDKLSTIVDWAILSGKSNKTEDILLNIRRLEEELQPPGWEEKRYTKVYAYLRLLSQKEAFEKAASAYKKWNNNGQSR